MKKILISTAICLGMMSTTASAFTLNFWDVDQGGGNGIPGVTTPTAGSPANNRVNNLADALATIAFRGADATFTSSGLDYPQLGGSNSASNSGLLKDFLGTDWASLVNNTSFRSIDDTTVNNASVFQFTGSIALLNGTNSFSIASDDGFELKVGGVVVGSFEGTRAIGNPTTFDYSSDGGIEDFQLSFFEDQNSQVGLYGTLNGAVIENVAPVPLPASSLLLLGGLGGLVALRRKKKAA